MNSSNQTYTINDRTKKICYVLIGIGVLGLVYGFVTGASGDRIWANLLINSFFFLGIAVASTFFMALQYATEAAYAVTVKRVYEAISDYILPGAICLVVVLLGSTFHINHLYHWMDSSVMHELNADGTANEHYDEVLAGKSGYLNLPFFWIRTLLYLGVWWWMQRGFRKRSLEEDLTGDINIHWKNRKMGAIFLIFYGVTSSTSAWDWIMSLDAHWYSTMFGWYTFAGTWISAIIMIIFFTLYLKRRGYLQEVNESHLHDLGKWMFAVSFLWTYLYFCQFMLIWYSNIPEEVTYYQVRWEFYKPIMWGMFFVNFLFPMLLLMSRDAKRNAKYLVFVGPIIFFSHWVDIYQMVMPSAVVADWHLFNPLELGLFCGFLGLFLFMVHRALTKAPLMVKNHPYLEESLHHEV